MTAWFERLWQDVRYGIRVLIANPAFALVAMGSLAIGIGANVAAFSWADALLLRPLPASRPSEIVTVGTTTSVEGFTNISASFREYVDLRERTKTFEHLSAFTSTVAGVATEPDALPTLRLGDLVSPDFFALAGVQPALGRVFTPEENQVPSRDAVIILGHDFWEQALAADPAVLGRRLRLNGIEFTVVGVMPASFTGMEQFVRNDFFAPIMMWPRLVDDGATHPLEDRSFRGVTLKARLAPGVTMARAQAEVAAAGAELARDYPETNKDRVWAVQTELRARIAQSPPDAMLIAMLTTLALAVLFVACANVAGLLTSRAPARSREIALRLAIGAGRTRLVRQLVTESLLIAIGGGVLGVAVGDIGIRVFQSIQLPSDLPVALGFQLDRRALVFSLLVAAASALLFGLVPAIQATRLDLTTAMKTGDVEGPRLRRRLGRRLLVAAQVAVSVVLIVLATFMYRGFSAQLGSGPGYRTDHLLMVGLNPALLHETKQDARTFYDRLSERARDVPGVRSVALASTVPMATDGGGAVAIVPEGYELPAGQTSMQVPDALVTEGYFDTIGIPIVDGRAFTEQDREGTPHVAVLNQHLAGKLWPDADPVGRRFQLVGGAESPWIEVVGVAKNSKYFWLAEPTLDFLYLPYRQHEQFSMVLLARSAGDPADLAAPLRDVVRNLNPDQPIFNLRTMEEFYRMRAISIFDIVIGTVAAMGLMGLGLAIVGIYGLMLYATTRRTREIGIRMAIGADRGSVLRMMLGQGAVLAGSGLLVGLAGAIAAGRLLRTMFPGAGVNRIDFIGLGVVGLAVLAVTLLAAYLPARRAAQVNPITALRYE